MPHANDRDLHAAIDRHTSQRPSARCAWCDHDHHGRTVEVQPSWLAVVPAGALAEGDVVCVGCGAALASEAADAELATDPAFVTVCGARRDGWIAALEADAEADLPELPWGWERFALVPLARLVALVEHADAQGRIGPRAKATRPEA